MKMETNEKTRAHRQYKLADGTVVPGVTTVINSQLGWNKNALIAWARREALAGIDPTKVRDEAADVGTITHHLIECHIRNVPPHLEEYSRKNIDLAENGFIAFLDWEKANYLEYYIVEYPVVSEKHRFGGTIDVIGSKDGKLWLIDLKTGKGVYPDHIIQVAAYKYAFQEYTGKKIHKCNILHLGRDDGSFQYHSLSNKKIRDGWRVFLHCKALYDLEKRL